MTTIFTTILETLSDTVLLLAIINTVNTLCKNITDSSVQNKKRLIITIGISCILSIAFNQNFFNQLIFLKWIYVLVNFSKYALLTAYMYKHFSEKLLMVSFIIQFICSTIASGILSLIPITKIKEIYFLNIVLNLTVRTIMLLIIIYTKNKNEYENIQMFTVIFPTHIYALILLSLFLSNGLIQTANFATSNTDGQIQIVKILALSITICTTVIIMSLLFNLVSKKYQSDVNSTLKNQIASQLYHYKQLEKINAEIRSFKHDYINHIKCISSMLSKKEYDDLFKYLNRLSASFPSPSFLFETGNYIADAILSEKQVNSPDNISIEFDGVIPSNIDNTDLCIILSNALDNAVEKSCLCAGDKVINVYGAFTHGYFLLKIKNPTVNTNVNGKMTTTKADKLNHGFGLANIKRTVNKYSGYISINCEENFFTLNITFSNFSAND